MPTRCWARPGSGGKKTGKNPTDRGKKGTKKSLVVDGDGGPLGVVIAGANVVEQKLLKETIEAIVIERPDPDEVEQNLNLDKGYDNPRSREAATEEKYQAIPLSTSASITCGNARDYGAKKRLIRLT